MNQATEPKKEKKTKKKQGPPIPEYVSPLEEQSRQLLQNVNDLEKELDPYYERLLKEELSSEAVSKARSYKRAAEDLKKAAKKTYRLEDELGARAKDIEKQRKKHLLSSTPSNASIDLKERENHHFAEGLNFYKLMLIFFIGCFTGVVIETLWCLLTRGYFESRAGLVYGPFNLVYGIGALVLSLCLYKFRNRGSWISFLSSILVGSVVEYGCSWVQELMFGTRSWDYSNMPFNINGRICLLYSIFWGILGVFWIKTLYPRISRLILKIPNKIGKIVTWIVTVFMVINIAVSGIAVMRWGQRVRGAEPSNEFWEFIDERFPDERMERIYANMDFGE